MQWPMWRGAGACAARLVLAREIESALASPAVAAPPQFTSNVMRAVQQQRPEAMPAKPSWWSAPLGVSLGLLVASVWWLVSGASVGLSASHAWQPLQDTLLLLARAAAVAPSYVYVAASGVIIMMVLLLQWIEEESM